MGKTVTILSGVIAKEVAGQGKGKGVLKFYTCKHLTFTSFWRFHVFQPSGEKASIKWITVGGRTSAVVEQVQKLGGMGSTKKKRKRVAKVRSTYSCLNVLLTIKQDEDEDSDLTELSAGEESNPPKKTAPVKRKKLVHSGLSQIAATGLTLKSDDEA